MSGAHSISASLELTVTILMCYKNKMKKVNSLNLEFETQPTGLRKKGVVALVMLVWLVFWVGVFSQTCCQPQMQGGHEHSSSMADRDDHEYREVQVAAHHEHDTTTEHENCTDLKSVVLVPAAAVALIGSVTQPVLVASHNVIIPEQIFSISFTYKPAQQSYPPPNRFLRDRRLLI